MQVPLVRLSEIALSIADGDHQAPPKASSGIPFLTIAAINSGYLSIDRATRYVPETYFTALKPDRKPRVGDVLFSVTGSIAIPAIVDDPRPFAFQRHIAIIRPDPSIVDTRYLWHALQTSEIKAQAHSAATGTAQLTIPLRGLRNFLVPLPPLPEQRRIVAKIDSLTTKSRCARDHLDHIPRLVEKYKQAVLAAAFRGDLTQNFRQSRVVEWTDTTIGSLIDEGPSNGWSPKSGPDATGALTLKLTATTSGYLRLDNEAIKRIYVTPPPSSPYWLSPGDILVQRANTIEYVGATAIFDGTPNTYIYPDLMMRMRVADPATRHLIWRFLNSETARRYFRAHATGTAGNMPKINGAVLRSLRISLPELPEERSEIVRRIEAAFDCIDRLAAEAISARKLINHLDQAMLAKAFRGELVPQNPSDEPAGVLLERIAAERGAAPKSKRSLKAKADA